MIITAESIYSFVIVDDDNVIKPETELTKLTYRVVDRSIGNSKFIVIYNINKDTAKRYLGKLHRKSHFLYVDKDGLIEFRLQNEKEKYQSIRNPYIETKLSINESENELLRSIVVYTNELDVQVVSCLRELAKHIGMPYRSLLVRFTNKYDDSSIMTRKVIEHVLSKIK